MNKFGYLIRRIRADRFEVSKWGWSEAPESIYIVHRGRKGWNCDSPGCRKKDHCKHSKLVERYLSEKIEVMELMYLEGEDDKRTV